MRTDDQCYTYPNADYYSSLINTKLAELSNYMIKNHETNCAINELFHVLHRTKWDVIKTPGDKIFRRCEGLMAATDAVLNGKRSGRLQTLVAWVSQNVREISLDKASATWT